MLGVLKSCATEPSGSRPGGEGSALEGDLFEEKNLTLRKKVENHKEASLRLLHLQMEASERVSGPFRATWGGKLVEQRLKPRPLFIRPRLLRHSGQMGLHSGLTEVTNPSLPSRGCLAEPGRAPSPARLH